MRRRIQAVPIAAPSASLSIGVSLTPLGAPPPKLPFTDTTAPSTITPTGPYAVTGASPYTFGEPCGWLIYMLGVTADDTLEWSVVWDDMESTPGVVFFVLEDASFDQTMAAYVLQCTSFCVAGITIFVTVNGIVYGPFELECVA